MVEPRSLLNRLVTVRINRDPLFRVAIDLTDPVDPHGLIVSVNITEAEAHTLGSILHLFRYNGSVRSITEDPNVQTPPEKGGA